MDKLTRIGLILMMLGGLATVSGLILARFWKPLVVIALLGMILVVIGFYLSDDHSDYSHYNDLY